MSISFVSQIVRQQFHWKFRSLSQSRTFRMYISKMIPQLLQSLSKSIVFKRENVFDEQSKQQKISKNRKINGFIDYSNPFSFDNEIVLKTIQFIVRKNVFSNKLYLQF